MKVQVLVCALLCVVAFAAASDAEDMLEVASFVETAADLGELQEIGTEHEGFPVPLTKKQRLTTMEPQYHGEPLGRKKYIVPEYAVPKAPKVGRRHNKNKPRVFSSHYFSPMPKPKKGGPTCKAGDKKCRRRWRRAAARRRRATGPMNSVETLEHHLVKNKGFVNPEIVANYPGGPRGDHLARKAAKRGGKPLGLPKKTLAPAPIIKFLEISSAEADEAVDTSAEAEEQGLEEADFSEEELAGREQVTVLNGPEQFFEEGFQAPDWADEEVSENAEEVAMIESADEDEEESEEESDDEDSEEGEDEEESDEESEEESDEESEEESDEEADEESEDSEEAEEVSLIEAAATADDEDEEEDESNESQEDAVDEMEENEMVAEQIDMDASEDDADQDEEIDEEEDSEDEDESEAQDEEESETEANEEAVAEMFEVDNHLNDADTLLAEVDAHITAGADSDAEADTEAEMTKGTPGSSVAAGQTWEDAQNEKLDALEAHLAAERAATPKFAAKVVAPTDLAAVDAEHQMPEFDQEEGEDAVETVAPEYAF